MQNNKNYNCFITDTHWRTSYYVCKSLAKKGMRIIGLRSKESIYDRSKYYSKIINIPSLESSSDDWLNSIKKILTKNDILIPISTEALKLTSKNYFDLSNKFILPRTPFEQIDLAFNKIKSIKVMQKLGIPTPLSFLINNKSELEKTDRQIKYPIVIKINDEKNISPDKRYRIAKNKEQLFVFYEELYSTENSLLIQEYIEGKGYGISFLANKGQILAIFAHQRLRESILTGGPSTYCLSIYSKILEEYANKFAEYSSFDGIAMLEFKYSVDNNKYYFLETNPRFWGTVELAIKCGLDFPYLYYCWMQNELKNSKSDHVKKNKKLKYLSMDLRAFSRELKYAARKDKGKLYGNYIKEFLDKDLMIGTIGEDWNLGCKEFLSSFWQFIKVTKNVIF